MVIEAVSPGGTAASAAIRVKTPSPRTSRTTTARRSPRMSMPWQWPTAPSSSTGRAQRRFRYLGVRDPAREPACGDRQLGHPCVHRHAQGLGAGQLHRRGRRHHRASVGAVGRSPGHARRDRRRDRIVHRHQDDRHDRHDGAGGVVPRPLPSASLRRYPYLTDVVNSADSRLGTRRSTGRRIGRPRLRQLCGARSPATDRVPRRPRSRARVHRSR